jgi:cell division control protein 45
MLWSRGKYDVAYNQIKQDSLRGGCTVLILVAQSTDALCACRILAFLLRSDDISYKIEPVCGYDSMRETNETVVVDNEEIRSVVTLGCGGIVNLKEMFALSDRVKCYVVDAHRPYHLSNVHGNEQIVLFDDEQQALSEYPENVEEESSESESSSDEEGEEDEGAGLEEEQEFDAEEGEQESKEEANASDDVEVGNKRKLESQSKSDMRAEARLRRKRYQQYYYSGTFHGSPASSLMYELAQQLNKENNDLLWLAIVGMTEQHVMQQCNAEQYGSWLNEFQMEVLAKNTDAPQATEAKDGTKIPVGSTGIWFEEEYRFMLHRHWSLFDSMHHSSYIASKLHTYKANGKETLQRFLAKMGLSLKQCQQKFTFMSVEIKNRLRLKLEEYKKDFDLEDITYGSFNRQQGFKSGISAADVVYGVSALLEIGSQDSADHPWQQNFNLAYDALSGTDSTLINKGIECSMTLQRAVVRHGCSLMERNSITRLKHFRYVFLQDLPDGDQELFSKPVALSKLALFLVAAYRESGRWQGKRSRPLVMLSFKEAQGTYLVVGVTCPQQSGDVLHNKFGTAFRWAAEGIDASFKHDGFETSVMEINSADTQRFVESLHNTMDA